MTTQPPARLRAATVAGVDALRRIARLLDDRAACILLNLADLLEGAGGEGAAELTPGDALLAEHIREQIAGLATQSTQPPALDNFLAETALAALKDTAREVKWLADAALDDARRRVLAEGWDEAMAPANRISAVRDAIAQRVALLEPRIGAVVATREETSHVRH